MQESASGGIESFQAEVKVYSSVDRKPYSNRLVSQYRLATKLIDGELYTRIDFPADPENKIAARTFVSNGKELILLDSTTNKVVHRGPVPTEMQDVGLMVNQKPVSLFQKLDISSLRTKFRELQCDVQSADNGRLWAITVSSDILSRYALPQGKSIQSLRIYLDETMGTVAGTEMVTTEEDGTVLTIKETNIYTEKDGIPILIGKVEERHIDKPYTIDTSDSSVKPLNTESAPIISVSEANKLIAEGLAIPMDVAMEGDPSDPDYTETNITVYESIQLNTVPDMLFKVF